MTPPVTWTLIVLFVAVFPVAIVAWFRGARWAKVFFIVVGCVMVPPVGLGLVLVKIDSSIKRSRYEAAERHRIALSEYPGDEKYREMMAERR